MCGLKFKEGDKVRIIRRKPNNRTGSALCVITISVHQDALPVGKNIN
jgi:hypothetical protein